MFPCPAPICVRQQFLRNRTPRMKNRHAKGPIESARKRDSTLQDDFKLDGLYALILSNERTNCVALGSHFALKKYLLLKERPKRTVIHGLPDQS